MNLTPDSPFYPLGPSLVILETPNTLAFFDRYPVSEGHALVVPCSPVLSLYELDDHTQAEVWDTVRQVRAILEERFHPAGFNIGINDGRAAGQTVPHAHVHIIPRNAGDVPDPRGGIRWVIPNKAVYWKDAGSDTPARPDFRIK
jgi:diadenosine tetraphosphate (Ap4A) HIT family hydrolase